MTLPAVHKLGCSVKAALPDVGASQWWLTFWKLLTAAAALPSEYWRAPRFVYTPRGRGSKGIACFVHKAREIDTDRNRPTTHAPNQRKRDLGGAVFWISIPTWKENFQKMITKCVCLSRTHQLSTLATRRDDSVDLLNRRSPV